MRTTVSLLLALVCGFARIEPLFAFSCLRVRSGSQGSTILSPTLSQRVRRAWSVSHERNTGYPPAPTALIVPYARRYDHSRIGNGGFRLNLASDSSAVVGAMALIGSSAVGKKFDHHLPGSGILGTLLTAAALSNGLTVVPSTHRIYDYCWQWILPGSLTLLLLGYEQTNETATGDVLNRAKDIPSKQNGFEKRNGNGVGAIRQVRNAILRVAGPFVIASIGSLVGCRISHYLAISNGWFANAVDARAASACLAASYIGGSVNLFATAKIIRAPSALLSSMAAADLIAMALYFGFLSSSLEWTWLRSMFSLDAKLEDLSGLGSVENDGGTAQTIADTSIQPGASMNYLMSSSQVDMFLPMMRRLMSTTTSTILVVGTTWLIVGTANRIEAWLGQWVPGTACAIIAILAPLFRSCISHFPSELSSFIFAPLKAPLKLSPTLRRFLSPFYRRRSLWNLGSDEFSAVSAGLSDWFFLIFFASIGMGVDLKSMFQMGPACLWLSTIALFLHLVITVAGSMFFLPVHKYKIELEDVWIASNAAIGGPATAAAFCNRLQSNSGTGTNVLLGRTLAATTWGVVGYGLGTMAGLGLFRLLGGTIP